MYIDNWETFYQQARELFIVEPVRTRYVLKYRHCDGKFSVKVTNDRVCLQYKSDQQIDLKKLEALNNLMFLGMAHGPDAAAGDQTEARVDTKQQQAPRKSSASRRRG